MYPVAVPGSGTRYSTRYPWFLVRTWIYWRSNLSYTSKSPCFNVVHSSHTFKNIKKKYSGTVQYLGTRVGSIYSILILVRDLVKCYSVTVLQYMVPGTFVYQFIPGTGIYGITGYPVSGLYGYTGIYRILVY